MSDKPDLQDLKSHCNYRMKIEDGNAWFDSIPASHILWLIDEVERLQVESEALVRAIKEHSASKVWDLTCAACYMCKTQHNKCKTGGCSDAFEGFVFDVAMFA